MNGSVLLFKLGWVKCCCSKQTQMLGGDSLWLLITAAGCVVALCNHYGHRNDPIFMYCGFIVYSALYRIPVMLVSSLALITALCIFVAFSSRTGCVLEIWHVNKHGSTCNVYLIGAAWGLAGSRDSWNTADHIGKDQSAPSPPASNFVFYHGGTERFCYSTCRTCSVY